MKNNIFGKNLRTLRTEKRLFQKNLGKELGVCKQTISFWEMGKNEPEIDMLIKIADYFKISLDDLLREVL